MSFRCALAIVAVLLYLCLVSPRSPLRQMLSLLGYESEIWVHVFAIMMLALAIGYVLAEEQQKKPPNDRRRKHFPTDYRRRP